MIIVVYVAVRRVAVDTYIWNLDEASSMLSCNNQESKHVEDFKQVKMGYLAALPPTEDSGLWYRYDVRERVIVIEIDRSDEHENKKQTTVLYLWMRRND